MKKIYFILAVLMFVSTSQAQFIRGYGLKAGTTISNQNWDYSSSSWLAGSSFDTDNRIGVNIGVFGEFLNLPYISIVAELNYLQKGMKKGIPVTTMANPDGTGEYFTWDTRLDYINISAFGKFRLNAGIFTPYILLGPKIDLEINKEYTLLFANSVENDFRKNRLGFKAGAGTEINLLPVSFLIEFLYDADFNELYENEILKVQSNSYDLRIGIML